ncbi:hypothetical protein PSY80_24625, partial [Shigella flexneri]|nr:hypothetical protein [Shigella flexneri]
DIAPLRLSPVQRLAQYRVPVVVEVILERVTNISKGSELDNFHDYRYPILRH